MITNKIISKEEYEFIKKIKISIKTNTGMIIINESIYLLYFLFKKIEFLNSV